MTSPLAGLVGEQKPRLWTVPPRISSAGQEVVDLAATTGLVLDPWEAWVLDESLGERADGTWAASSVGLIVPRQNGKGSILEARELAGLFLFEEEVIIHSAHEFKTSKEAFRRIMGLIKRTPDLAKRVDKYAMSHGEEGIHLKDGRRLLFATRSSGGGRGFSGEVIILDEAYNLTDAGMAALIPTLGTAPNPQVWYTSSSPDKDIAPCEVISRVRARALGDNPGRLAYFEWSIDAHTDFCPAGCDEHDELDDPDSVRKANPGLGIRLNPDSVEDERAALSDKDFARERLGVGNWVVEGRNWLIISEEQWTALTDLTSEPLEPVAFALAATPDLSYGCISVAGARDDGMLHTEITSDGEDRIDHRPGITWMIERAKHLQDTWSPCAIVVDRGGPAGSLIPQLEEAGVEVTSPSTREYAGACMTYYSSAIPRKDNPAILRHRDQAPLNAAVAGVTWRDLADLKAWNRRGAVVDISPLEASTLAVWGFQKKGHIVQEQASPPWVMYR